MAEDTKFVDVEIEYRGEQLTPDEHKFVLRKIGKTGPGSYTVTKRVGDTEDGIRLTNIKVDRVGDYAHEA